MATLTLIPSGAGLSTQLTKYGAATNWQAAASTAAIASVNVSNSFANGIFIDLYTLPSRSFTTEVITSVLLNGAGQVFTSEYTNLANSYVGFNDGIGTWWGASGTYSVNPRTGLTWTAAQINALQIGVKLDVDDSSNNNTTIKINSLTTTITYTGGNSSNGFFLGF
jgi:hypothetical protein